MIQIGDHTISTHTRPFIIAEMSGNHNQSLEKALEIVDVAATTGADALKIQTYTPDTMTIDKGDGEFFISDAKSLWKGESLYNLYKIAHTPWDWHAPIMERAKKHGIICFSTPFDLSSVEFLEKLNVPAYKIASFENIDLPLIKRVAETGKPIIISTGMASVAEIDEAVQTVKQTGNKKLVLLKCTSTYPASAENSNILTIPHMKHLFGCEIGLSDHTIGIGTAIAAVAHGATVIEKHFTINRNEGGVDSTFSIEPEEMRMLVSESKSAWQALGKIQYGPIEAEKPSLVFRRSLYITEDVKPGDILTVQNLRSIRPGYGLPPKFINAVLGRRVTRAILRGSPLTWDMLK
jgi:pseudaminic acid synthase